MVEPESRLFCPSDAGSEKALREQQRIQALSELGLLEAETVPVFEEATQIAAHSLKTPICILGFLDQKRHWFKSAVGLSRIGLMNQLAQERQVPRHESFCSYVVESHQVLAISDALSDPDFSKSILVQRYGIRAYLGVPLMDAAGHSLGAIAVMDLEPRTFTLRDIQFLEIIARWSMSEFERNRLLKGQLQAYNEAKQNATSLHHALSHHPDPLSAIYVKLELLAQLTQELRTPLTSVLGMASVVSREIYGPLTGKQKEYLEIIQHSGKYLLSVVNEISELGALNDSNQALNLTSSDIEMLCQQALNSLSDAANRREQQIRLSVEPGRSRIWVLDKDKVRQMLYHLVFSVLEASTTGSVIHIHVSHKGGDLNLAVSASHPWLGEGLTQVDPYLPQLSVPLVPNYPEAAPYNTHPQHLKPSMLSVPATQPLGISLSSSATQALPSEEARESLVSNSLNRPRENLRLLLSCHLAELHGGQISIQGTPESGYRYVVSLPDLTPIEQSL